MEKYVVKQINNLIKQSKEDGFHFVERLINEFKSGRNTFNYVGEGLFGVFNEKGVLVAIGGLNKDPFSNEHYIGRLRRFYVDKAYRRNGIGSLLVKRIIDEAKAYYKILVLHTDTEQADKFYTSIGFTKSNLYPHAGHFMEFLS